MFRDKHIDTIQINPNKEGVFSLVSYTCDLAKKSGWTDIKINKIVLDIIESDSYDNMLKIMKNSFSDIATIKRII